MATQALAESVAFQEFLVIVAKVDIADQVLVAGQDSQELAVIQAFLA